MARSITVQPHAASVRAQRHAQRYSICPCMANYCRGKYCTVNTLAFYHNCRRPVRTPLQWRPWRRAGMGTSARTKWTSRQTSIEQLLAAARTLLCRQTVAAAVSRTSRTIRRMVQPRPRAPAPAAPSVGQPWPRSRTPEHPMGLIPAASQPESSSLPRVSVTSQGRDPGAAAPTRPTTRPSPPAAGATRPRTQRNKSDPADPQPGSCP